MRALALALLLAMASMAQPGPAQASPCPAGSPTAVLQNDNDSGRDAGQGPSGAVAVQRDGLFWGSLDPPAQLGLNDIRDWFVVDVPEGARDISVEVKSLGKALFPTMGWPLVYWLEVWRGDVSVAFRGSWEPPVSFASPGGERLFLEVYIVPLAWEEPCSPADAAPGLGALPAQPQLYRVRFECQPACFA